MYKIEKEIPIPPARNKFSKADSNVKDIIETLNQLEIDECFLIPMTSDDLKDKKNVSSLRSRIAYAKARVKLVSDIDMELISREEDRGLRVWRTK
jgi:4-hydroxy-3-methylbut-2-en-1-yl diphosphate synthase IspG/GcpE